MRSQLFAVLVVSVVTGCAASAPSPQPAHASRPPHRVTTPDAPVPPARSPKATERLSLVGSDWYEQHDATWSKPAAPSMRQEAAAIAVDPRGDVILAGASWPRAASTTKADVFVTKFDSGGLELWRKRFGDAEHQAARGAAVDANGNVVVVGVFHGTIDFGGAKLTSAGESDVFVAKLDAAGKHLWSKRFGGKGKDDVAGVAIDAAGGVWFAGTTSKALDFGNAKAKHDGGGTFVANVDALGKKLEGRWLTATPTAMALDAKSVALAAFSGDGARFVTKIDHARADQVTTQLRASPGVGGESDLNVRGIAIDSTGAVVVVGDFLGEIVAGDTKLRYAQFDAPSGDAAAGKHDAFVLKLDTTGRPAWAMRYGAFGDDRATGVSIDKLDDVVVTGAFEKTVDFGGGPIRATGAAQLFVLKLDASGHLLWSTTYDAGGSSARVASDASGNVFLTGELHATTDFGGGPVSGTVAEEMFLAKLPP